MAAGAAAAFVIQAVGSIMQGQASANALTAQANLQQQNAQEAEAQGAFDANKSAIQSENKIGTIQASYGAAGVTANSGSVLDVLSASASNAEMDRLNILHGADLKAINMQNQASMENIGAQSAVQGSYFSAFGSTAQGGAAASKLNNSPSPNTTTTTSSTASPESVLGIS